MAEINILLSPNVSVDESSKKKDFIQFYIYLSFLCVGKQAGLHDLLRGRSL